MKATKKKIPSIKQLNAAYAKATPAERRRMIARDALVQLNAEKFTAEEGVWARVHDGMKVVNYPNDADPLQPILLNKKTTCECCGVGAIFLSYVRLNNNATSRDGYDLSTIQQTTNWPEDNLRLIELAFEEGAGSVDLNPENIPDNMDEYEAVYFGKEFDKPKPRLKAILQNIAANKKGLFTP